MGAPFSRRHGFREPRGIVIREDAPQGVRIGYLQIAHDEIGLTYHEIRTTVCGVLRTFPDENNWSEVPNIRDEVTAYIHDCVWYSIYDIIEATDRCVISAVTVYEAAVMMNARRGPQGVRPGRASP